MTNLKVFGIAAGVVAIAGSAIAWTAKNSPKLGEALVNGDVTEFIQELHGSANHQKAAAQTAPKIHEATGLEHFQPAEQ